MTYELRDQGLLVEAHRTVPIVYRGIELTNRYYIDLVVGNIAIVELKAVSALVDIHSRQVLTYLKLTGLPVGL